MWMIWWEFLRGRGGGGEGRGGEDFVMDYEVMMLAIEFDRYPKRLDVAIA